MFGQLPALILGVLSCATVITTTFWNQWAISSPNSSGILGPVWAFKYLFGECLQYQTGQYQCQELQSQFLLPVYQTSVRALMIISIFLSTMPVVGILLGMQCTRIFENSLGVKRKIMIGSGLCYFFAAIFTCISMVWFTIEIYKDFFATIDNFVQWELGATVYLGYLSSFLSFLSFLACVCAHGPRKERNSQPFSYEPAAIVSAASYPKKLHCKKNGNFYDSHRYTDYV